MHFATRLCVLALPVALTAACQMPSTAPVSAEPVIAPLSPAGRIESLYPPGGWPDISSNLAAAPSASFVLAADGDA